MNVGFIMLLVMYFPGTYQVQDYHPAHTRIYNSLQACEKAIPKQQKAHPIAKDQQLVCAQVERNSEY